MPRPFEHRQLHHFRAAPSSSKMMLKSLALGLAVATTTASAADIHLTFTPVSAQVTSPDLTLATVADVPATPLALAPRNECTSKCDIFDGPCNLRCMDDNDMACIDLCDPMRGSFLTCINDCVHKAFRHAPTARAAPAVPTQFTDTVAIHQRDIWFNVKTCYISCPTPLQYCKSYCNFQYAYYCRHCEPGSCGVDCPDYLNKGLDSNVRAKRTYTEPTSAKLAEANALEPIEPSLAERNTPFKSLDLVHLNHVCPDCSPLDKDCYKLCVNRINSRMSADETASAEHPPTPPTRPVRRIAQVNRSTCVDNCDPDDMDCLMNCDDQMDDPSCGARCWGLESPYDCLKDCEEKDVHLEHRVADPSPSLASRDPCIDDCFQVWIDCMKHAQCTNNNGCNDFCNRLGEECNSACPHGPPWM